MAFRCLVAATLSCVVGPGALALDACPLPDLLQTAPVPVVGLFDELGGNVIEKGEFETTEQFEARKGSAVDPSALVLSIETRDSAFQYDADRQVFKLFIPTLEPTTLWRRSFSVRELEPIIGGYDYGNPVQIKARRFTTSEREYEASNAYGASTLVTEQHETVYIVFDGKGRRLSVSGDNLFEERKKYDTAHLEIPVPLERAPDIKSQLEVVALIDPRPPLTAEARYRSEPTRQFPRDVTSTYKIIFADIQCVGVVDGEGQLLAHWKTR